MPLDALAIRFGPRLVASASTPVIGEASPIVHFPQQAWHLNHWIHIADLNIQFLGRRRNLASRWRHDQRAGFQTNTFEFSGPCSVREALEVEVEHLTRFGKPLRAVTLNAQSETILLFHCGECRPRHQMLVDRPEGSAAVDPNVRRSKPVSQGHKRGNLVESPIGLPQAEDESSIRLAEVGDRDAIRKGPPLLGIEPLQQRNCRKKRIVTPRGLERERLQERTGIFVDGRILLSRHGQWRCLVVLDHRLKFRLHAQQPVPANFLIEDLQSILAVVVRRLQGSDRVEEHAQRLGGIGPAIHVPLLLAVAGLREQPTHQLDEHRHGIVGELLAELDDLRHDQSMPAAGVEIAGQPGRRGVPFTDHLVPPTRGNPHLQSRIDLQRAQEGDPFGQPDQV